MCRWLCPAARSSVAGGGEPAPAPFEHCVRGTVSRSDSGGTRARVWAGRRGVRPRGGRAGGCGAGFRIGGQRGGGRRLCIRNEPTLLCSEHALVPYRLLSTAHFGRPV
jgi:hypothetical protein